MNSCSLSSEPVHGGSGACRAVLGAGGAIRTAVGADPLAEGSPLQGGRTLTEPGTAVLERRDLQAKPAEPAEDAPVTSLLGNRDAGLLTGTICQGLGRQGREPVLCLDAGGELRLRAGGEAEQGKGGKFKQVLHLALIFRCWLRFVVLFKLVLGELVQN